MKTLHFPAASAVRRLAAVVLVVAALVLTAAGYWSYRAEERKITQSRYEMLAASGKLKSDQIQQWRKVQAAEVGRAAKDSLVVQSVEEALAKPGDPSCQKLLLECLRNETGDSEPGNVLLFDRDAKLLASNDPDPVALYDATRRAIHEVLATRTTVFSDFFRASDGPVHLEIAAPVLDSAGTVLAVLILRYEAASSIYPVIRFQFTPGSSAEANLVVREGDEVVFLTDGRHRDGSALALRLPLNDTRLPAAQAVLGQTGIFVGRDYLGIEVVSDLRPVPGSPWFLVSKVDKAEIRAEVISKALVIFVIGGLFILLSAATIAWFFQARQTRIMGNLIEAEKRRAEALEQAHEVVNRHRTILQAAMDGFWLVDLRGRILEVNAAYCRMSGYSEKELLAMSIGDLECLQDAEQIAASLQRIGLQGESRFESQHRRKDGSIFDIDVSVQSRPTDGHLAAFMREITERKQAQGRIERLAMLYAALSECSNSTVHSATLAELLPKICRTVVERGGMKMAWIGTPDPASGRFLPTASYGEGLDYLLQVEVSVNPEEPIGRGPTGVAFREQRAVWCLGFRNDPAVAPWCEIGRSFGWESSAAIPLRLRKRTVAVLSIYSEIAGAFDEEIRALLVEMADNVSLALDRFAEEDERKQAHKDLLVLRTAVEQAASTFIITDAAGNIEYANPAFEKCTGYAVAEVIGKNPRIFKSGEQGPLFYRELWSAITSGGGWRGELCNRRKDGSLFWESATISPVTDEGRKITHFVAVKEDITGRKLMEARLLEALDRSEAGNRVKREFLSVMSHELRTPLNGIIGLGELLAESQADAGHRDWAQAITDSGHRLLKLVENILEYSSTEKTSLVLEFKPMVLADLLEAVCQPIRKAAADKGLNFGYETLAGVPEWFTGDWHRISQILAILLGNAVKFTPLGAIVLRLASVVQTQREWLEFAVVDTGVGIPRGYLEHVFQPFTQADSTSCRPYEGAGLGLAISLQLAKAMGGSISVASTCGQGSTFTLRLPTRNNHRSVACPMVT